MLKAVFYSLAFCALVLAGDRCVNFAAGRLMARSRNSFVQMYEGKCRADALLLGNSRMDRNCDAKELERRTGQRALNLGLGGNHTRICEALFLDYIDRYGPPQLLVLELTQCVDSPDSMGEMMIFTRYSSRMRSLAQELDPKFMTFQSIFKSLRYNNDTFWRLASEAVKPPSPRQLAKVMPREEMERWKQARPSAWPAVPENIKALNRLLKAAKDSGVEVRLIIAPMWCGYKAKIENFDTWKTEMAKHIGEQRIWDYSDLFADEVACFNDGNHLNALGAKRFSEVLIADGVIRGATTAAHALPSGKPVHGGMP